MNDKTVEMRDVHEVEPIEDHRRGIVQLYYRVTGSICEFEKLKAKNQNPRHVWSDVQADFKGCVMVLSATLEQENIDVDDWLSKIETATIDKPDDVYKLHRKLTKILNKLNLLNISGVEVIL